ncbi:MAG: DUF2141 domain-containing protein [Proteobacteria bacterium]|nr:DUF2141 domain-containing protein [Pseudomonadota bacterium]
MAAAIACLASAASSADLTIEVSGLRSSQGTVHVAIYDRPEAFPKSDGMLNEITVPITGKLATALFSGLTPGRYAVAVYHDENSNNEFDQGLFGIPLEDFAFSNGARAFFGPPSFSDAAIDLGPSGRRIRIPIGGE